MKGKVIQIGTRIRIGSAVRMGHPCRVPDEWTGVEGTVTDYIPSNDSVCSSEYEITTDKGIVVYFTDRRVLEILE